MAQKPLDKPEVGWKVLIHTAKLKDFGHEDATKAGPLMDRLEVLSVADINPPAPDGSRYQCRLKVRDSEPITARENQITIARRF
ncbi:MAG: hypothetical protein AAB790_02265 [Patescibacteria group bacterium]